MEDTYKQLQETGRNCVDCLVEWIKESKIIDKSKEAEDKARQLFSEVVDKQNVELEKFQEVMGKLAAQQSKSVDQLHQMLVESMPRLQKAFENAAKAFQETMKEK